MPKKEGESQQVSDKDESVKNVVNAESSTASVSSNAEQAGSSNKEDGAEDDGLYFSPGAFDLSMIYCIRIISVNHLATCWCL